MRWVWRYGGFWCVWCGGGVPCSRAQKSKTGLGFFVVFFFYIPSFEFHAHQQHRVIRNDCRAAARPRLIIQQFRPIFVISCLYAFVQQHSSFDPLTGEKPTHGHSRWHRGVFSVLLEWKTETRGQKLVGEQAPEQKATDRLQKTVCWSEGSSFERLVRALSLNDRSGQASRFNEKGEMYQIYICTNLFKRTERICQCELYKLYQLLTLSFVSHSWASELLST